MTTDPYFCLYITEVGMTLVDCWKIYKSHHKLGGSTPSVSQFADIMALEMIEYAQSLAESSSTSVSVEESCLQRQWHQLYAVSIHKFYLSRRSKYDVSGVVESI